MKQTKRMLVNKQSGELFSTHPVTKNHFKVEDCQDDLQSSWLEYIEHGMSTKEAYNLFRGTIIPRFQEMKSIIQQARL